MRHVRLYKNALKLDDAIDRHMATRGRIPRRPRLDRLVKEVFGPRVEFVGNGAHKRVYAVYSRTRELVLKVAKPESIQRDYAVYQSMSGRRRGLFFAKVYWTTKYCLLQKRGDNEPLPDHVFARMKRRGKRHGLTDIRRDNIRKVGTRFRVIDANFSARGRRAAH